MHQFLYPSRFYDGLFQTLAFQQFRNRNSQSLGQGDQHRDIRHTQPRFP